MRLFNREVFRGTAYTTDQYTPAEFNGLLGSADRLAIQVVANRPDTNTTKVIVQIQHSNDNEHWNNFGAPQNFSISPSQLNVGYLSEALLSTSIETRGAFVRLNVTVDLGFADVVLTVTGRSV